MQKRTHDSKEKQFEELVIDVKSVVKVNKGGRQLLKLTKVDVKEDIQQQLLLEIVKEKLD